MKLLRRFSLPTVLLMSGSLLSSCTPEKAQAVRVGAVQFKTESFACIDAIDIMRQQEIEAPPQPPEEFVNNILSSKNRTVQPSEMEFDPTSNQVELSPETKEAWKKFIDKMKQQYAEFAAIYDRLEAGSFLAADAVSRSGKYAEILTVQMAVFAKVIVENPPQLLQYRTDILARMTRLKREYQKQQASGASEATLQPLRQQAAQLLGEWEQVKQEEQALLVSTVTPCLKAALLGKDLRQLIARYDELDMDTLNATIASIIQRASVVTGQNFSSLKLTAETVFNEIRAAENLRVLADSILRELPQQVPNPNSRQERELPISFWRQILNNTRVAAR